MNTNTILLKMYAFSNLVVGSVLFFICMLLGYDWKLILSILSYALVLGLPPVITLHLVFQMIRRIQISKVGAWILLLAAIPLLSLLPALLFVQLLPGDTIALLGLSMLSGYAGIFSQALNISKFFNSFLYETE